MAEPDATTLQRKDRFWKLQAKTDAIPFELLVSDLTARFVNYQGEDIESEIVDALGRIRKFFDADRTIVLNFTAADSAIHILYQSHGADFDPLPVTVNLAERLVLYGNHRDSASPPLSKTEDTEWKKEIEQNHRVLQEWGIHSLIDIPLCIQDNLKWIIAITSENAERTWPTTTAPRLLLLAELLYHASLRCQTEHALRESNERLDLAACTSDAGFWSIGMKTNFEVGWATEKAHELFGFDYDDVFCLEDVLDKIHPDDVAQARETIEKSFQSKGGYSTEFRLLQPDAPPRWLYTRACPHFSTAGDPLYLMGITFDVTAQKEAEERSRKQEKLLAEAQRIARLGSWEWDIRNDSQIGSDELYNILGIEKKTEQYQTFLDLLHPDDRDKVAAATQASLDNPDIPYNIEFRIIRPDGTIRNVYGRGEVTFSESGEPISMLGTGQDITEQKKAEEKLIKQEKVLSEAQRIAHMGSFEWDIQSGDVAWSDEIFRIFGLDQNEFVPTYEAMLTLVHPNDVAKTKQAIESALSNPGTTYEVERRMIRPDGVIRVVYAKGEVTFSETGTPLRMLGTIQDITEAKTAREIDALSSRFFDIANRTSDQQEMLQAFTAEIQHSSGCEAVNIRLLEHDGSIPIKSYIGFPKTFHESESPLSIYSDSCMCTKVITGETDPEQPFFTEKGSFFINTNSLFLATATEDQKGTIRNVCNAHGYESIALVPIPLDNKAMGLIHLADTEENRIPLQMVEVMEGIAVHLGMAIQKNIAETEVRFSQIRLSQAAEGAHLGMFEYHWDGEYALIDDKVREIIGIPFIGNTIPYADFLHYLSDEEKQKMLDFREKNRNVGTEQNLIEFYINSPIKSGRWISMSSTVVERNSNGEPLRTVGFFRDITEGKESQLALENAFEEINSLKERLEVENVLLKQEVQDIRGIGDMVSESPAFKAVLQNVSRVAKTDSLVLITGETGTGKEVIAEAIHRQSNRAHKAIVKVNCAALPANLIEGELFGREKGAYTGALTQQKGRFEVADGGTLFLDEIGDLPLELQTKLLRVLQEGSFEHLGSNKTIHVDVRVVAATNRELPKMVAEGTFRRDLYYRLNVFPIHIPPLRERKEDIPLLVWDFLQHYSEKLGKTIDSIPQKTMKRLQNYQWPGNVRELRNLVEHAVIMTDSNTLSVQLSTDEVAAAELYQECTLEEMERAHIQNILEKAHWRVSGQNGAAEILGLKPTTLNSKLKKLGITRPKK